MEQPLWEADPNAFMDPPTIENPNWMRVGLNYSPGPKAFKDAQGDSLRKRIT